MTTEIRNELRKLRIDEDERLLDMAARLEKSSAFISAVERGTKTPPEDFVELVIQSYKLTEDAAASLRRAADKARKNHDDQKNPGPVIIELDNEVDDDPREDHDPVYLDDEYERRGFNMMDEYPHWEDEIPEPLYEEERTNLRRLPFRLKAEINVSGASFEIGCLLEKEGDAIFIRTDEMFEPVYMSKTEARLLIAALEASISEIEEN